MSISLVPKDAQQPPTQLTTRQYITLDTTSAVIVDIEQLDEARDEARQVSRRLHNVESLSELDWSELADLCRTAHRTTQLLQAMLEPQKEEGAR